MPDQNSPDKQIKVTDKRMFTPDGELREEYRNLGDQTATKPGEAAPTTTTTTTTTAGEGPVVAPGGPTPGKTPSAQAPPAAPSRPTSSAPAASDVGGAPPDPEAEYPSGARFEDLVGLLAQTTVTFLQQASQPQSRTESLEQAQFYLDLLGLLDEKSKGNLAPGEQSMLQDALRQLRLAMAQRA